MPHSHCAGDAVIISLGMFSIYRDYEHHHHQDAQRWLQDGSTAKMAPIWLQDGTNMAQQPTPINY